MRSPAMVVALALTFLMCAGSTASSAQISTATLAQANSDLQAGEADKAIALLTPLPSTGAGAAEAQNLLCRVRVTLEQWSQAAAECQQAATLDEQNSDYHMWLGRVLGQQASHASFITALGIAKHSLSEMQTAAKLNPQNGPALSDLGDYYAQAPGMAGGGTDKAQAVAVEVHPGDEIPINFGVLTSSAYRVTGTLIGLPSKDMVEIMFSSKDQGGEQIQQLGEGGKFEFQNVLPGSYTVSLMVVSGLAAGQPHMERIRVATPIEVTKANVDGLRLRPDPGGDVRGKFRMDNGQKFDWTQLHVILAPLDERESGIAFSGSFGPPSMAGVSKDGTFELKNVPGGNYQLVVGAGSNNLRDYITKSVTVEGRDVTDSGFLVSTGTFLDVVVSANGATIEGTVTDSKGKPVAYATVVDVPSADRRTRSDLYQQDTTDERGHFSLHGLNPGKYTVLALDELEEDTHQPEFLETFESSGKQVQLDEGARSNVTLTLISTDVEAP